MKSTWLKIMLFVLMAAGGTLCGYWLGHRSAVKSAEANSKAVAARSLRAVLTSGTSGQTVDWRTLFYSTGKLNPDLLAAWARSLGPKEIADVLNSLKGEPPNTRRNDLMGALYNAWAESDPKGFLGSSNTITVPRLREGGVDAALRAWAEQNPKDALQWIKENPGTSSTAASQQRYAAAIAGYATNDPAGAVAEVSTLNDDNVRDRMFKVAATKALADALADKGGFSQAASFFSGLAAGQTRDDAYTELAQRWAESSPQEAATWVESMAGDPTLKSSVGMQVAKIWAENDPASAATWAAKVDAMSSLLDPGSDAPSGQLLATAIRSWTAYDLDNVGAFLNLLPSSPTKDPAVAIFALRSSQEDPSSAFQWVNSITSEDMRMGMTVGVALEWMQQDANGFHQFLATTTALSDQQKVILAGIPPEALQGFSQFNSVLGGGDAVEAMLENAIIQGKGEVGAHGAGGPASIPANAPGGANFNPADYAPAPESAPAGN